MEDKKVEEQQVWKSERFKHMLCYVPLGSVILFVIEKTKTPELLQHIKYGVVLLVLYALCMVLLWWMFGWLIFLVYAWVSWFLWWKAYMWKDVKIDVIDDLEKKYLKKEDL